ncbi:hypothetical protein [Streptomyces bluensis]|uniref:hypothetical protein n=1 Tax=Streptomyces bluensis TaxID=33897 RepID=UPI003319882A
MTSTDEQNQILDACRAHLSQRTSWDEKPEILVLKRHSDTRLSVQHLPVPDLLWEMLPPARVVAALAHAANQLGVIGTPETIAVVLRYEGFTIKPKVSPQADEALRRRAAGGSSPRNEHIPGRLEQRCISAVDRQGRHYLVSADRRSDGSAAPAVGLAVTETQQVSGTIAKALTTFCKTVWPHQTPGHSAPEAHHDDL